MLLGIAGTLVQPGTVLQRSLFLSSASILAVTAYVSRETMLTLLQIVVTVSALLAFVPGLSIGIRMLLVFGPAVLSTGYLVRIGHRDEDPYWPVGGLGLIILGAGLSLSGTAPFIFNLLLATGAALIAAYSGLQYFLEDVRIQAVWIVLNTVFMINPLLRVLAAL